MAPGSEWRLCSDGTRHDGPADDTHFGQSSSHPGAVDGGAAHVPGIDLASLAHPRGTDSAGGRFGSGRAGARPGKASTWLVLDGTTGRREMITDRGVVRKITGVPPRDLRIMDPSLGYPSSIMIRDRALVVNL